MPRRAARRPGAGQTALSIETPSLWRKSVIAPSLGFDHLDHALPGRKQQAPRLNIIMGDDIGIWTSAPTVR